MNTKLKNCYLQIANAASTDLQLPLFLARFIRILSHLQIIVLIFPNLILLSEEHNDSLTNSLAIGLYEIKSFIMLFRIKFEMTIGIITYIFCLYLLVHLGLVAYLALQALRNKKCTRRISRILAFISSIHSQVLFFPIHSLYFRLIYLQLNCQGSENPSFYCQSQWIFIPGVFSVLNICLAFSKEFFYHQLHIRKDSLALKNNLYPLIILLQKTTIIPLFFFLDSFEKLPIVFNALFCLLGAYLLHSRLPFYNLKILTQEICLNSISLLISLCMVSQIFGNESKKSLLVIMLSIPFAIKLGLFSLRITLQQLAKFGFTDPFKAAHFPVLLKEYFKNEKKFPRDETFNKISLIIAQFLSKPKEGPTQEELKESREETKTRAYSLIIQRLYDILRRRPNNELLMLCITRLYIKSLKDVPNSLSSINKLKAIKLSLLGKNSLECLIAQLESEYCQINQEGMEVFSYVSYFNYREQTKLLKKKIKNELIYQLKLWESLNENPIKVHKAIPLAEIINEAQNRIEEFWQKEIQKIQRVYVNAPIIYSLYVEIILGLSILSASIRNKTSKLIVSKHYLNEDIMNITMGKSAIITASIEPETSGTIVDASSSVKPLFNIDKEHLIGSNVNIILPKALAAQHDEMLQKSLRSFDVRLNKSFTSYGKSLGDSYFPCEVTVRALPSLKNGLNIVSQIKKTANNVSLLIVDYYGKVMDCSKDLQLLLNISSTGTSVDLSKLCPDLAKANAAFNKIYFSKEEIPLNEETEIGDQNEQQYCESEIMMSPMSNPKHPSSVRWLLKTYQESEGTPKSNKNILRNLRSKTNTMETVNSFFGKIGKTKDFPQISQLEAEETCKLYKDRKKLQFNIIPSSVKSVKPKSKERVILEVQVEPMIFAGSLYKVIKVINVEEVQREKTLSQFFDKNDNVEDTYVDEIISDERSNTRVVTKTDPGLNKPIIPLQEKGNNSSKFSKKVTEDEVEKTTKKLTTTLNVEVKNRYQRSQASSMNSASTFSDPARQLNIMFKTLETSRATRIAIIMVYVSTAIILTSLCVDLTLSRQSLDDMNSAVDLINLTDLRLFKSLVAWKNVLKVYSRSVGLTTYNSLSEFSADQEAIRIATTDMITNNNHLRKKVDDFTSNDVSISFHAKLLNMWIPFENVTATLNKVTAFDANSLIADKNNFVANFTGSINKLKGRSEVLFSLNNTANAYLDAVSDTSFVQGFYKSTQNSNVNLLRVILILENLSLIIPILGLSLFLKIIFNAHRSMFEALSRIQKVHIEERINEIHQLKDYLEQDVEDNIIFNQTIKPKRNLTTKNDASTSKTKRTSYYSRNVSTQSFVWMMTKYFSFALFLALIILALLWVTFMDSIQGFDDLSGINSAIDSIFESSSRVASFLPKFYFSLIFFNQPQFKIRRSHPNTELALSLTYLKNAKQALLRSLTIPGKGIVDPNIKALLHNDLCEFFRADSKSICESYDDSAAFGLLGILSDFYQSYGLMIDEYLNNPNYVDGKNLLNAIEHGFTDMHTISFEGYRVLGDLLIEDFQERVMEIKDSQLIFFQCLVVLIVVSMFLIRAIIIEKYKNLDLAIRKVLRLVPFSIVKKNKVIVYYLSNRFDKELSGLKNKL